MKAYKGFNKDMTCRGFQFKEGETYHEDSAHLCESGFHACEDPLDCFGYYAPANSVYHEVELDEVADEKEESDSKICGKTIKIGAKIDIAGICKAHIEFVKSKCKEKIKKGEAEQATSGDRGCSTSGDSGCSTSGDRGCSTSGDSGCSTSGYRGCSTSRGSSAVGKQGAALARGNNCKVKGGLGSILVIVEEYEHDYGIKDWKSAIVDGVNLKPDTWYKLENGEFVEVEDGREE